MPPKTMQSLLNLALQEGEGQFVEFKEALSSLDKELVAFANASGGSVYIGVNDRNQVIGIPIDNKLLGQIQDIARNCDPSIEIDSVRHPGDVLEIKVPSGADKPYRCKDGFFLRTGAISQKLKRDEIIDLIAAEGKFRFDEYFNPKLNEIFDFKKDLSVEKVQHFKELSGISINTSELNLLSSLGMTQIQGKDILLNNGGLLFFTKDPQKYFKESGFTCVRYQGSDKFSIIDRQDFQGDPFYLIEESFKFFKRNCAVQSIIDGSLRRSEKYDYPLPAIREAIINSVAHRDYHYDSSHIYLHFYSDRLEIENPGGLIKGLSLEDLGNRSARRNRLIADILLRAKYIEAVGSGFQRIERSLKENGNPPYEVVSSNYFSIRFFPTLKNKLLEELTPRQRKLHELLEHKKEVTKSECSQWLEVSEDTALRELKQLIARKLVGKKGLGKKTTYFKI